MVNRQLEMIYILMKKGTVTAQELAQHFEVSMRTVYRDVESLSMAGIPVYANRGKGGGIRLMERFVLDKLLLSEEEQRQILAALTSLRETRALVGEEEILKKLETFFRTETFDWVAIDFSDWSGRRGELFEQIKEAILKRKVLEFDYYGQYGDMSHRQVEPLQLLFKEYTWYVRAYCRSREALRLFKVLRMKRVEMTGEIFEPGKRHQESAKERERAGKLENSGRTESVERTKVSSMPETMDSRNAVEKMKDVEEAMECAGGKAVNGENDGGQPAPVRIVFHVDRKEAYRVYDRFEENEITVLPQGDFEIQLFCPLDDWVYGLILSFGPSARVLEPEWVRKELEDRIRQMAAIYGL